MMLRFIGLWILWTLKITYIILPCACLAMFCTLATVLDSSLKGILGLIIPLLTNFAGSFVGTLVLTFLINVSAAYWVGGIGNTVMGTLAAMRPYRDSRLILIDVTGYSRAGEPQYSFVLDLPGIVPGILINALACTLGCISAILLHKYILNRKRSRGKQADHIVRAELNTKSVDS